jgi:hypothetical protein
MPARSEPRVTIVMTARERHSLTEGVIDGIVADTWLPYRFMYLDCASPAWLRHILETRAAEWHLDVVRFDEALWPQEARQRIVGRISTDYVVFIDNDVTVEPGWLAALVACADETHAGIVAPLYLLGDGVRSPKIHMAGGTLVRTEVAGRTSLEESHRLMDADPRRTPLARGRCDFGEFHCMLVRAPLLREGVLDPAIRCVHEHIDTALSVKARGYEVYLEPSARVTYLGLAEYMLDELAFLRARWSASEADASIAAFCRKWNLVDDERSFGDVRAFVRTHVATVDPLRQLPRPDGAMPMARDEHRQTRSGLMDLAVECGYHARELALLSDCYRLAHILVDGGYRPCGRPFIDHLVGTASVLVRFGFRMDVVAAGLLHAAYTHAPARVGQGRAAVEAIGASLGGRGSAIEARVRAYTHRESTVGTEPSIHLPTTSLQEAEIVAIVAANEIDLHLSGELRYSGRTDVLSATRLEEIREVCRLLGVEGLYRTLRHACDSFERAKDPLLTRIPASYRLADDRSSMLPMANNVLKAAEALAGGR